MKRWLAVAALMVGLAAPWCNSMAAGPVPATDVRAIHNVVQSQLDALSNDDAARAFDLATSEKRMLIGNPDNFLRLIREEYSPIYRHRDVTFSEPEVVDGDAIQALRITDTDGKVWLAFFSLQQDADHSWKIDGCQLLETTSIST